MTPQPDVVPPPPADEHRGARLPSLTGMRFVAAFLVFLAHCSVQGFFADSGLQSTLQDLFVRASWAGVQFFFMLSGFVLTFSARPGDRITAFWRRRAAKLYPNNIVVCVVVVLLLLITGGTLTVAQVVPNLLLVQSWAPIPTVISGVNTPAWSLCCELLFYALFPLLLPLLDRVPARSLWWLGAGVLAFVVAMPTVAAALPDGPLTGVNPPVSFPRLWFVYGFPVVRLADFVLGMVLGRLVLSGQWPRVGMFPATVVVLVSYAATVAAPVLYAADATMAVGLACLIGAGATTDLAGRPSLLAAPRAVALGEVSFAFYLVHVPVLTFGHLVLGGRSWSTHEALVMLTGLFTISLVLGRVLNAWVEVPAMNRLARKRTPTRT
ncbi:acyltransferase [Actinokineospora sp. PR83]|uniref:acyltransferase family protein n=1 Tax=Actinokineospora sp. PR83 TaxID=2884908 RepID=UPI0027DF755A|nr:acyltransferase [Actinokineospora sp. PR83]MCG8916953.1 acyltransferase [Actinokineospora sp. PR83]